MNTDSDQEALRNHQLTTLQERVTETYKSLIALAVEGFRYLALINGGAIVALLTYLGSIEKSCDSAPNLQIALLGFILGIVACGLAMLSAYVTQLRLFEALVLHGKFLNTHKCAMGLGLFFYILSLFGFIFGAYSAVSAFLTT